MSLRSERDDRIDPRGAPRRQTAGEQADTQRRPTDATTVIGSCGVSQRENLSFSPSPILLLILS
jgi:hypothetical protein